MVADGVWPLVCKTHPCGRRESLAWSLPLSRSAEVGQVPVALWSAMVVSSAVHPFSRDPLHRSRAILILALKLCPSNMSLGVLYLVQELRSYPMLETTT